MAHPHIIEMITTTNNCGYYDTLIWHTTNIPKTLLSTCRCAQIVTLQGLRVNLRPMFVCTTIKLTRNRDLTNIIVKTVKIVFSQLSNERVHVVLC